MMSSRVLRNVLAALCLVLHGCAAGSPPSRFYMLAPSPAPQPAVSMRHSVGLGPVELGEYLRQPQFVTRMSEYEFKLSEFNRWAEPLHDNVISVLRENLSRRLSQPVTAYPWVGGSPDYRVVIEIPLFDCKEFERCTMVSYWRILDRKATVLRQEHTRHEAEAGGSDYQGMAAALSVLLGRLSDEIAQSLRSL